MNDFLVTCICPTMPGRDSRLLTAIDYFEAQTYRSLELLVDPDAGTIGELSPGLVGFAPVPRYSVGRGLLLPECGEERKPVSRG